MIKCYQIIFMIESNNRKMINIFRKIRCAQFKMIVAYTNMLYTVRYIFNFIIEQKIVLCCTVLLTFQNNIIWFCG